MEVNYLVTEVEKVLQDATYDASWIIGKFNEALTLAATMYRIPGLQTTSVVKALATANAGAMPKTYLHDLFLVTTQTYPQGVLIAPNIKELSGIMDPRQVGPVQAVAVDGKVLSFRPVPEMDEDLTLFFYAKPKALEAGGIFPDYIPEILQKEIFQNYAQKEAYLLIEDGIDGVMPNTQKYSALAMSGLAALASFYPNAPKGRPEVRRKLEFF